MIFFGPRRMRFGQSLQAALIHLLLLLPLLISSLARAQYQDAPAIDLEQIQSVMRGATSFDEKAGDPPVYKVYTSSRENPEPVLSGYAFYTPDYPPEEVGYSAPIDVLVGMNLEGGITGIKVLYYRESYRSIRGDFLSTEGFQPQFRGMAVTDAFRVGRDVDGVSRATITSWAVSRGVRNAARKVARSYLQVADSAEMDVTAQAVELMEEMSWEQMIETGYVRQLEMPLADGTGHKLSFAYIGHESLAELMIGAEEYSQAERDASSRVRSGNMVLAGIDGNASSPFRQERLAIRQGDEIFEIPRRRFVYAGSAESGKIADQVRFAGAIVMPVEVEVTQPFSVLYNMGDFAEPGDGIRSVDYQLNGIPLALVEGRQVPPEFLPAQIDFDELDAADLEAIETGFFAGLLNITQWERVVPLLVVLPLVLIGFLRKSARIRWAALSTTLLYLGFYDGGFLSVSHITNAFKQGPALFLNDVPLLLIAGFTVVTTLIWGRVFCSSLCPFGALQDFLSRFVPKRFQRNMPQAIHDKALYIKYGILAFILIMAAVQSDVSYFQYFEPFGTIFFFSQSFLLWAILIAFLLASSVVKRFYCRYACPLGAALGVVSIMSPLKISRVQQCDVCKVCEHSCPTAAIRGPKIDFKECVRCDICESKLITKAGVCKHEVEDLRGRVKGWEPIVVQAG